MLNKIGTFDGNLTHKLKSTGKISSLITVLKFLLCLSVGLFSSIKVATDGHLLFLVLENIICFFDLFPFKFVLFLWLPLFRFCTCWIGTLSYPFLHLLFCVFWEMAWTLFLTSVQFIISAIIFLFPKSALFSVVLNSFLLLFHVCNIFSLKTMNF